MDPGRRLHVSVAAVALLLTLLLSACTSRGDETAATTQPAPVVTPTTAYGPFHYVSGAQRAAFEAFLTCAERHGVSYEGPYSDSTGEGLYLRVAPGESVTHAEQEKTAAACPQFDVASFGTVVGHLRAAEFERAAVAFAGCVAKHVDGTFPEPAFGHGDAVRAFWRLPFDWSSRAFTEAVAACLDPLKSYMFGAAG